MMRMRIWYSFLIVGPTCVLTRVEGELSYLLMVSKSWCFSSY